MFASLILLLLLTSALGPKNRSVVEKHILQRTNRVLLGNKVVADFYAIRMLSVGKPQSRLRTANQQSGLLPGVKIVLWHVYNGWD